MESIPSNDKDESSDNANEEQLQPEEQEPRSNNGESIDNANRDWPSHVLMSISRGVPAYNAINQGNDMEWKPNVSQIDRQRCTAINRGVQGKRKRDAASFDDEVAVEGTNRGRRHHCCERTSFGVTRTQEIDANVGDDVHSHESVNNLNARHRYWATVLDSTSEEKVGEGSLVAPGSNGAGNSSSQPSQFRACAPVMRGSRQNQQHAVCEMCQTTFKRKYDLKTHIEAVHEKKRPHVCPYSQSCKASFAHRGTMTKHLKRRSFQCSFEGCGALFSERGNLNKHVARAHERNRSRDERHRP